LSAYVCQQVAERVVISAATRDIEVRGGIGVTREEVPRDLGLPGAWRTNEEEPTSERQP
jgi:hypothetical protein